MGPKKHFPAKRVLREVRSEVPRVALLMETSREVGRGILRGIERYVRQHGPWSIHVWPGDYQQVLPDTKSWGGTGIITRTMHPETAKSVLQSGLPLVAIDLSEEQKAQGAPFQNCSEVYIDTFRVGVVGAEHLMQQGFGHYAFVGEVNNVSWSRLRRVGFAQRLEESGFAFYDYPTPRLSGRNWGKEVHRLGHWLRSLPKPIGLMAANDVRGRQVIEACYYYNIEVPLEVAVLGVDNDQLICNLCDPPMSSIAIDTETGGFRAAEILDILMQRERKTRKKNRFSLPPMKFTIQPTGVVSRRSTEFWAVKDECVIQALRFIHINASLPLTVDQVVNHLNVSRRTLEMRFQQHLRRSILSEINRLRLERIKLMLGDRSMTVAEIAFACGFETEAYLCRFFRKATGHTTSEYRKQL